MLCMTPWSVANLIANGMVVTDVSIDTGSYLVVGADLQWISYILSNHMLDR